MTRRGDPRWPPKDGTVQLTNTLGYVSGDFINNGSFMDS